MLQKGALMAAVIFSLFAIGLNLGGLICMIEELISSFVHKSSLTASRLAVVSLLAFVCGRVTSASEVGILL
jgi:hypothetical protein